MSMVPGMSDMLPKGSEAEGTKRMKVMMTLMDSMTDAELDAPNSKIFNAKRVERVCRARTVSLSARDDHSPRGTQTSRQDDGQDEGDETSRWTGRSRRSSQPARHATTDATNVERAYPRICFA